MRIIVIALCVLIATLTVQNYYLQENLQEVYRGEDYYSQMIEKYSTQLHQERLDDEQK